MFAPPATRVRPESSVEQMDSVTTSCRSTLSVSSVTVHVLFYASSNGELGGRLFSVDTACTCATLSDCELLDQGPLCCLCVHRVFHWQYGGGGGGGGELFSVDTACTCATLSDCELLGAAVLFVFTVCFTGSIRALIGPAACA